MGSNPTFSAYRQLNMTFKELIVFFQKFSDDVLSFLSICFDVGVGKKSICEYYGRLHIVWLSAFANIMIVVALGFFIFWFIHAKFENKYLCLVQKFVKKICYSVWSFLKWLWDAL